MEKHLNKRKYPNYNGEEEYYRGFSYYELALIFRHLVLEGGQKSQKMEPFLDEFNSAEYHKLLKSLIRLGFEKVDLDRLKNDVEKIKVSKSDQLRKKYHREYEEKLKSLNKPKDYEEEEED
jgi:hypothetical protein